MIRAIRLHNDENGRSHVRHGHIDLVENAVRSAAAATTTSAFQETESGGSLDWHTAPRRQYVITLAGVLDFVTRDGEQFRLERGWCWWPRTPSAPDIGGISWARPVAPPLRGARRGADSGFVPDA